MDSRARAGGRDLLDVQLTSFTTVARLRTPRDTAEPSAIPRGGIVVVDALAEENFHLLRDDLFLVGALHRAFADIHIHSSPASVNAIDAANLPGVHTHRTVLQSRGARTVGFSRLRYMLRTLRVGGLRGGGKVIFQSFYEPAVVLFGLLHRSVKIYLLVTNNLAAVHRKGIRGGLKRWLLKRSFDRAAGIIVYTRYATEQIRQAFPTVGQEKVHVLRFHQAGIVRDIVPFGRRRRHMAYVGWARPDKGLDRFLKLAASDTVGQFTYGIYGTVRLDKRQEEIVLDLKDRLEVVSGYMPDEVYIEHFRSAMFIVLPYSDAYAGSLSGVFCDAISTGTPVIASCIEPFTEYFEAFGALGHLVDFNREPFPAALYVPPNAEAFLKYQTHLLAARTAHGHRAISDRLVTIIDRDVVTEP